MTAKHHKPATISVDNYAPNAGFPQEFITSDEFSEL
jgi:hypothetical protein